MDKRVRHGHRKRTGTSSLYNILSNIKKRCYDESCKAYPDYGGRGIRLWSPWHDYGKFITDILNSIGNRPSGCTLDRIDNNKNYEPGNVKWSTRTEQNSNKRNNILIEHEGQTKLLSEWAVVLGISYSTLKDRYRIQGLRGKELLSKTSRKATNR